MKKAIFLACLSSASFVQAQVKMNSSGYASIGNITPASSTYELTTIDARFTGTCLFDWGSTSISNLKIETTYNGSYYFKALVPTLNNQSRIGYSSVAFNTMYSYNYTTVSDGRQKENVRPLKGSLEIVKSLNGIKYDFKREIYLKGVTEPTTKFLSFIETNRKNQIGFIAQEVKTVLPEVVQHDDSTDIYTIDYSEIIPVLVEAIKEQQEQIDQLSRQLASSSELQLPNNLVGNKTEEGTLGYLSTAKLFQNSPNPSSKSTQIEYFLPDEVKTATIYIYDMSGLQLKSYALNINGNNSIIVSESTFKAGIYFYSLVADNHLISTKRMLITD